MIFSEKTRPKKIIKTKKTCIILYINITKYFQNFVLFRLKDFTLKIKN